MKTTSILRTLAIGSIGLGMALSAVAQVAPWPTKPIRLVVGFAPGGGGDFVARSMSDALGKALGQPVIVENRAGAGSSIAAAMVAKAAPDGYTILIASPASISVNPALNPKVGYTARDLVPITKITNMPLVIAVNPATGINSVQELIARARQSPGTINYATSGNGSAPHMGGELFMQLARVQFTHIPFRGGGLAIQSVVAGDTQVTFGTPPSVLPMVQAGRLRALAVSTREPTALVPGVPGMAEAGLPDYGIGFWYGFFVPVGTPPAVVRKIFEATTTAMEQPSVKAALAREGTEVALSPSPDMFSAFLAEDSKFWVKLAKDAGIKID